MNNISIQIRAKAILEAKKRGIQLDYQWPKQYVSARTGKPYIPQNDDVRWFIGNRQPRYMALLGGEGGGKSAAGIIKDLENLKAGLSGIMVSSDLEHFKKSIWPTAKEWIPWNCVIERHRYRQQEGWEPHQSFTLTFKNEVGGFSDLICGGAKEDQIGGWEGPNVGFVHFDEARRHKTANALKVFDGRARIPGPNGEKPQVYLTTTPRKHWLFNYFAGCHNDEDSIPLVPSRIFEQHKDFKNDAWVGRVFTEENIDNLDPDFVRQRAQTLTASEIRILLEAQWEDETDVEKFVDMVWWHNCTESTQPLGRSESAIIALDAAIGSENVGYAPDCFAMIMVTRHPQRRQDIMVRYCGIWEPQPGQLLDFAPIEAELRRLCSEFAVLEVAYDAYQLHDMATRLKTEQVALFKAFNQGKDRLQADKQLQQLIMSRRIAHDGNPLLAAHIDNANIKKSGEDGIRLVKKTTSQKIDAAVALSMASDRCLYYNLD